MQLQEVRVQDISFHNKKWTPAPAQSVRMLKYYKKERHFQANIKHLTLYLWFGCIHVKLKFIPNFCKSSNLSKLQEQLYSQKMQNISVYVYKYPKREQRIGCTSVPWKWRLLNEYRILKPSSNKLINQTSYKYVRSVIYYVPLISIRYQWDHCHVIILHMHSTVHWHFHDYKIEFIFVNCWIFELQQF